MKCWGTEINHLDWRLQLQQYGLRDENLSRFGTQETDFRFQQLYLLPWPASPHLQESVNDGVEVHVILIRHFLFPGGAFGGCYVDDRRLGLTGCFNFCGPGGLLDCLLSVLASPHDVSHASLDKGRGVMMATGLRSWSEWKPSTSHGKTLTSDAESPLSKSERSSVPLCWRVVIVREMGTESLDVALAGSRNANRSVTLKLCECEKG